MHTYTHTHTHTHMETRLFFHFGPKLKSGSCFFKVLNLSWIKSKSWLLDSKIAFYLAKLKAPIEAPLFIYQALLAKHHKEDFFAPPPLKLKSQNSQQFSTWRRPHLSPGLPEEGPPKNQKSVLKTFLFASNSFFKIITERARSYLSRLTNRLQILPNNNNSLCQELCPPRYLNTW